MSKSNVFNNELKVYKSDITGEEKEYRVNNYLWICLEKEFGLDQSGFDDELLKNPEIAMCKFVTAVFLANDMDVSYEDVLKHTDQESIREFYNGFFEIAFPLVKEMMDSLDEIENKIQEESNDKK